MSLTDLPDNPPAALIAQIRGPYSLRPDQLFTLLGELGDKDLTMNMIVIAWYNKYGDVLSRKSLSNIIARLHDEGRIIRVRKGIYRAGLALPQAS